MLERWKVAEQRIKVRKKDAGKSVVDRCENYKLISRFLFLMSEMIDVIVLYENT